VVEGVLLMRMRRTALAMATFKCSLPAEWRWKVPLHMSRISFPNNPMAAEVGSMINAKGG
jgi:hypothetical protein